MSRVVNKEWMSVRDRSTPAYMNGVEEFINFAVENDTLKLPTMFCPCFKCKNKIRHPAGDIRKHLIRNGVIKGYTTWYLHGERTSVNRTSLLNQVREEEVIPPVENDVGIGIENLVDAAYGVHEDASINNQGDETNTHDQSTGNEKYDEYKRLAGEKLYPSCEGRRSYAQKAIIAVKTNPDREITSRADKWLVGHENKDGECVSESAKPYYDQIKDAIEKRKRGEGVPTSLHDDPVTEVFGNDKRGRVRAMGSHVTKTQLKHLEIAQSKEIANKLATDLAEQKIQLRMTACLREVVEELKADMKDTVAQEFKNLVENHGSSPVGTPKSGFVSNSGHQSRLSAYMDKISNTDNLIDEDDSDTPDSNVHNPPVLLINKKNRKVAKGLLVTDSCWPKFVFGNNAENSFGDGIASVRSSQVIVK